MSRIRSVHPGFFRDDRLVPCSAFARLLFIGLGVEADDKGIFEWKPVTLKMSIFPGDSIDVVPLLDELIEAGSVMKFEAAGRAYGAIRNFRKFQKPKTPNDIHPMPDHVAEYVAFPRKGEIEAVEADPFPTSGEKSPQMEDGGWKMEDEEQLPPPVLETARPQEGARDLFMEFMEAYPDHPQSSETAARAAFSKLTPDEQEQIVKQAERKARWTAQEAQERGRSIEAQSRYSKTAANFIESGMWREPIRLKSEFVSTLPADAQVVHRSQIELFHECETLSGETVPPFMAKKSWPAPVVAKAVANIKARASPQAASQTTTALH